MHVGVCGKHGAETVSQVNSIIFLFFCESIFFFVCVCESLRMCVVALDGMKTVNCVVEWNEPLDERSFSSFQKIFTRNVFESEKTRAFHNFHSAHLLDFDHLTCA